MWLALVLLLIAGPCVSRSVIAQTKPEAPAAVAAEKTEAGKEGEKKEEGGLLDIELGTALFTILIFLGLLVILRFAAWKPIMQGLKSREAAIRDSIEAAAKAKSDAEKTTRDLEAKMVEAQKLAANQLAQAKADAQKVADTIRAQAETESAALKDRTLREIEAAKQQAVSEINGHAAELGTAIARRILQRQVTVDDQQKLVDQSLVELAKKN
jgi:F-type H+-transporting ATPase subunit b